MALNNENLQFAAITVMSLLNFILITWQTIRRVPNEVDKMKAEKFESLAEAAESNMQGAQISNDLLMKRLADERKEKQNWRRYAENLELIVSQNGWTLPNFDPLDTEPKIKAIKMPKNGARK